MAAVIGALRANLSAGWAEFAKDMGKAANSVTGFGQTFRRVASDMRGVGAALTGALTLPIALAGGAVAKTSKDFEAAMNRVEAATGAAGDALDDLREKARDVGVDPNNTANAIEAAEAMEVLAKNGLNVDQILGGALDATTKLAAAAGADLAPAADVATDVMLQFGKAAGALGPVVDGVTGTLLASKFGFDDYRLALGQAGGVAGGLGVEFNEFNAVIAATSALFSSGQDAGTSFKTFLLALSGNSVEAKRAIDAYGLSFYDANGNMRSMAEIAGELDTKLGDLNDQAKTEVLKRIFGTDAMRTAIGLMNAGADGIRNLDEQIQAASAQEQMDARMKGLSGAMKEFGKAATELKLAIGDSGLLGALAALVRGAAGIARALADLPGPVLAVVTAIAGIAAVAGPAIFAIGAIMTVTAQAVPLLAMASVGIGKLGVMLAGLPVVGRAAAAAMAGLRGAMSFLLGPWGLAIMAVVAAVGYLASEYNTAAMAARELERVTSAAESAIDDYAQAVDAARDATGKERDALLRKAEALREVTRARIADAAVAARRQMMEAEQAERTAARFQGRADDANANYGQGGFSEGRSATMGGANAQARGAVTIATEARKEANAAWAAYERLEAQAQAAARGTGAVANARGGNTGGTDPGVDIGPGGGRGRGAGGPTVQELERAHEMEAARARNDRAAFDALSDREEKQRRIDAYLKAGLTATAAQAKAEGEITQLAGLRAAEYARNIASMEEGVRLSVAQASEDIEGERAIERTREQRERTLDYQREGIDLAEAERKAAWDIAQIEKARTAARERWLIEDADRVALANAEAQGDQAAVERLRTKLALEARIRELRLEGGMTPEAARAQAEAEAATLSLSELIGKWREFNVEAARTDYLRGMQELNRLLEAGVLSAEAYAVAAGHLTDTLHTGMAAADPMFKSWSDSIDLVGDALGEALKPGADLKSIWESFRLELLKILVLEPLIAKFKRALKGMGEGGGGGIFGALGGLFGGGGGKGANAGGGIFGAIGSFFGGFRAEGGSVLGGRAYIVGEEGPELFAPGRSGAIVPNDALKAGPNRGVSVYAPITIDARDAVLASWVEERVAAGVQHAVSMSVPAAVEAAKEVVPAEMANRQRDMF